MSIGIGTLIGMTMTTGAAVGTGTVGAIDGIVATAMVVAGAVGAEVGATV